MLTLLKNGRIYDGSGDKPYFGSILVEDYRIVSVGEEISEDRSRIRRFMIVFQNSSGLRCSAPVIRWSIRSGR